MAVAVRDDFEVSRRVPRDHAEADHHDDEQREEIDRVRSTTATTGEVRTNALDPFLDSVCVAPTGLLDPI
jgi:hypothetical protein